MTRLDNPNGLACGSCGRALPRPGENMIRVAKGLPPKPRCLCHALAKAKRDARRLQESLDELSADLKDATPNEVAKRLAGLTIEEIVRMNHGEFDVD